MTDRLNLSAGVRYSDELKDYTHQRHNPDLTDIGPPPDPINIRLTGVNGLTARFADSRTDWRLAADYGLNDAMMVYASVATGYKSGGVNPRPFFPEQLNVFNPETMTSLEFGFKSTLADNSVRLNAAVFTTDYEDIQLLLNECEVPVFIDPDGIGAPCVKPANVGNADVSGIELELEWFVTDDFMIDGSVSTLDFQYTSVDPVALTGSSIAPLDMVTPYTPELKWAMGIQYGINLSDGGRFNVRLDASYQDEVFTNATNDRAYNLIEDYTLANARFWWESADDDWEFALEIRNLTDELYYLTTFDQHASVGQVQAQPAMPRTWAITATKSF
jgi:iron complex outermembrane receptor protein